MPNLITLLLKAAPNNPKAGQQQLGSSRGVVVAVVLVVVVLVLVLVVVVVLLLLLLVVLVVVLVVVLLVVVLVSITSTSSSSSSTSSRSSSTRHPEGLRAPRRAQGTQKGSHLTSPEACKYAENVTFCILSRSRWGGADSLSCGSHFSGSLSGIKP